MAINLKFPMQTATDGAFGTNDSTIDAVVDDLRILMITNHGERPIHYDFGANLRSIMFEPTSAVLTKAEDLILLAIEKWMPFVQVISITAFDQSNDGSLNRNDLRVRLEFTVGQLEGVLDQTIVN